jgi:hypothetical protein
MDDRPATKRDLEQLKTELMAEVDRKLAGLKAELEQKMDDKFAALQEMIRDNQTELLRAFLPFQEAVSVRFRHLETTVSNNDLAVKMRMDYLERRLMEVEKKLFLEPPAA